IAATQRGWAKVSGIGLPARAQPRRPVQQTNPPATSTRRSASAVPLLIPPPTRRNAPARSGTGTVNSRSSVLMASVGPAVNASVVGSKRWGLLELGVLVG